MFKKIMIALGVSFALMANANAAVKSYDISWVGSNNYTLSGHFSFDDATSGTTIDETELTSFSIEGFLNGITLGTYSGPAYNFSFNAVTGLLGGGFGGSSGGSNGQIWNAFSGSTGIGLVSGGYSQGLYLNSVRYINSILDLETTDSTLKATLSTVPLPAALPLYAAGMAILGFFGMRRKRQNLATA